VRDRSYLPFPERPAFAWAARGDHEVSAVRDRPAPFVRVAAGLGARRSRTRSDAPASRSVKFDVSRADCRGTAFCTRSFDPGRLRARRLAVLGSAPSFLLRFFSDMLPLLPAACQRSSIKDERRFAMTPLATPYLMDEAIRSPVCARTNLPAVENRSVFLADNMVYGTPIGSRDMFSRSVRVPA
jgi:hypothetical protein